MRRLALSFITVFISATVMSQNITVAEMQSWRTDIINEQYDVVSKKMNAIFHGKISDTAPDSIKYYYYVINAAIEGQSKGHSTLEREYCQKALDIRETQLGVLDPEYLELLWALGKGYENSDIDRAISYFQKAIVIGQTIFNFPNIIENNQWPFMIYTYGLVVGDLATVYEKKGWLNEVVELYEYAYDLCSVKSLKFDITSYIFKNRLAWFYEKYNEYGMAIQAYDEVLQLIQNRIGKNNRDYVNELYFKANTLCKFGQNEKGIATYKEAIDISESVLETNDELWSGLYGNYYRELAEAGDIAGMKLVSAAARQRVPQEYSISMDYCECLVLNKAERYEESLALSILPYSKLRQENKEASQIYEDYFNLFVQNYRLMNNVDSVLIFCESEKLYLSQKNLTLKSMAFFDACNVLGVELLKLNKLQEAYANLKEAEQFCLSVFDSENGIHAILYHNLGRCYMLQKDYANAQAYLTKSKELQILLYGSPIDRTILYLQEVETMLK